jgi:hypothetical protein
LTGELSDWLGIDVPATIVWEYPTVELVTRQIVEHCALTLKTQTATETMVECNTAMRNGS